MLPALAHIDAWIFDLDNTLYPASADLFALIDVRMGAYIERLLGVDPAEARRVQKDFFHAHGTTLRGLMDAHGVAPAEFLADVHDIALDRLAEDARLATALAALPGRKLVFTNGDADYARRVLDRLGLGGSFEAVHDIHAAQYRPKPDPRAYQAMCAALDVDPARALFAEDMAQNLKPAKAIGMTTVWVDNGSERGGHGADPGFIDYQCSDIGEWLHGIINGEHA